MRSPSRREFLGESALFSAAALLGTSAAHADDKKPTKEAIKEAVKADAGDKLRVAVVGVNGRGMSHVGGFNNKNGCEIVTICDCDEAVISKAMKAVEKARGSAPKYEKDIRKLVEDKNIDIISIATPNHWHALMAIWAMQNGKDVYVEKPVSHNVSEGRRIVEASRKYKKICQAGTQSRSMPGMRAAMDYMHTGKLGKVRLAYGTCYKSRPSIGDVGLKEGPQKPPATMDYDLWCGPAPNNPPHRRGIHGTVHYDWHWIWDYGNGDLGNQGIHEMDKARWGLGKEGLPLSVASLGGRFGYIDDGQTANTQLTRFDYGDCELIFEVRGLPTKDFKGAKVGNVFFGTEGVIVCPSYSGGYLLDPDGKKVSDFNAKDGNDDNHFGNFIKAVRSRKIEDLNGEILEGHLSSALCHLGNISYRLGTEEPFSKDMAGVLGGDKDALAAFDRMREHLTENKVSLADTKCRVGRKLMLEAGHERFSSDNDANAMLTREYRKGFEVPAKL